MQDKQLPVWFRAYVFIPILTIAYVVIPLFVWDFSPHALTHTVPDFLLGATDWGTGNIGDVPFFVKTEAVSSGVVSEACRVGELNIGL